MRLPSFVQSMFVNVGFVGEFLRFFGRRGLLWMIPLFVLLLGLPPIFALAAPVIRPFVYRLF